MLLLVAGVQYLLLRSRRIGTYGGVDIRSDAGRDRQLHAIEALARPTVAAPLAARATRPATARRPR